jgi:hypothetical protein
MRRVGLRIAFRTVVDLFADGARLGFLTLQSRAQLAAENLFLRKPLALYLERQVRPRRRRRDSHRAGRIVAVGRLASIAGDRQARYANSPDVVRAWDREQSVNNFFPNTRKQQVLTRS